MKRLFAVAGAFLTSLAQASDAPDPLQPFYDFIRQQPGDVALQVIRVGPEGKGEVGTTWNATQPMPLASSMKIVVLAAYARAVAAGTLKPDELVTLAQWESFYLPGTDGGVHSAALKALDIPADGYGRALDGHKTVTLDTLARFMMEVSDNAATDYILTRLGKNAVPETIRALGLTGQGDIGPLSGLFTAWDQEGAAYLKLTPTQRRARDWFWADKVRTTPALRDPVTLQKRSQSGDLAQAIALANQTPPQGTAGDYAALMGRVLSGQGFAPAELAVMRRHLGWPVRVNPANRQVYNAVYAKGGSLGAGVLTENLALDTKAGHRVAYSLFLRNVPLNAYASLSARMDDFMLTTLIDPAAYRKLLEALKR